MEDRHFQIRCRVLAALWLGAVIVTSLQAAAQGNNNFEIFRTAVWNLLDGRDLYGANPGHRDFYKYSPTFALLFAPFALLPRAAGLLLWNGANAAALYWGLGRLLAPREAFAARAIVFLDTVGSMQNAQSNALSAGLMILAFVDFEKRRELRASVAIGIGALIKIFPLAAASFCFFRPYRIPRFVGWSVLTAVVLVALPLVVTSPGELIAQYRSWAAISESDALTRGYSVMEHVHLLTGADLPNWPIQLLGLAVLVAPLSRFSFLGLRDFRLLFLASVLMFCVIFNHKAESPSFVVALAGVAIWFATAGPSKGSVALLVAVLVGTTLSASDLMPERLQEGLFEPYRLKTLPVLAVWIVTQTELWRKEPRRKSSAAPQVQRSARAAAAR